MCISSQRRAGHCRQGDEGEDQGDCAHVARAGIRCFRNQGQLRNGKHPDHPHWWAPGVQVILECYDMTQGNMWKYPGESRSHKLINKENWPCLLVLVYLRDATRNKHTSDHSLHCHVWQQAATSWRHNGHNWLVTLGQKMIYAYWALLGLTFLLTWTYWSFLALLGWLTQSSFPSVVIQATGYSSESLESFVLARLALACA